LYQAYHLLKKIKSAQMSTCRQILNLLIFPTKKKSTDEQTDSRQIWFSGTPYSICANAQGSHWRAAAVVGAPTAAVSIAVTTATVSLLTILVDCCLCPPRPLLLQPLLSLPTSVTVTVVMFVVVVIVVVVVVVDVIVIVIVVFAIIVFIVLVVLVIVFSVLIVVIVVFVVFIMFVVVIVVVVFVIVNKLLSPPPPCLCCQF
jgi:hypothetical protein